MALGAILGGAAGISSLLNAFKGKKDTGPSKLELVANVLSGLLGGAGSAMAAGQNAQLTREQLAEQRRQFDASQGQRQGEQALAAQQMNPLLQQQARQKNALIEQLLKGMSPVQYQGGQFTGGLNNINPAMFQNIASFFSPQARQAAEGQFAGAANAASAGKYGQPNFGALGYPAPAGANAPAQPTTSMPDVTEMLERERRRRMLGGEEGMPY